MGETVQMLWIGERLSTMERLSILSFLANGHPVRLFVYDPVAGVPDGVEVCDGNEVLPRSEIFVYRDHPSYSGFANYFRYQLLHRDGGWWFDTDMICLRPLRFEDACVISSESMISGRVLATCSAMRMPPGSEAMQYAAHVCREADRETLYWGDTGPWLMNDAVERFRLWPYVRPTTTFCPIPPGDWQRLIDPDPPQLDCALDGAATVHLWNEQWRRNGVDKDAVFAPTSLYELLRARYGC
jgi:hypothetical protein